MSHPVIERAVTERSDSEFYAGAPTLEGYFFTLPNESKFGSFIVDYSHSGKVGRAKGKGRNRFSNTTRNRSFVQHGHPPHRRLSEIVSESSDVAGNDLWQLSELVSELASRTRSYSHNVIENIPAERGIPEQNRAVTALLALEFSEPNEADKFPHNALTSFSQDDGAEIERILGAGAPDWVRELRQKLGR